MSDSLDRLYAAVLAARDADPATSRTARQGRGPRPQQRPQAALISDNNVALERRQRRHLAASERHGQSSAPPLSSAPCPRVPPPPADRACSVVSTTGASLPPTSHMR